MQKVGVGWIIVGESFLKKKWYSHFQNQSRRNIITDLVKNKQSWEDGNPKMFDLSLYLTLWRFSFHLWGWSSKWLKGCRHKRNRHLCRAFTLSSVQSWNYQNYRRKAKQTQWQTPADCSLKWPSCFSCFFYSSFKYHKRNTLFTGKTNGFFNIFF